MLPIQPSGGEIPIGGPSVPCVGIICENCGNSHLINMHVLGLKHIIDALKL